MKLGEVSGLGYGWRGCTCLAFSYVIESATLVSSPLSLDVTNSPFPRVWFAVRNVSDGESRTFDVLSVCCQCYQCADNVCRIILLSITDGSYPPSISPGRSSSATRGCLFERSYDKPSGKVDHFPMKNDKVGD